jgi:hypothetical protein
MFWILAKHLHVNGCWMLDGGKELRLQCEETCGPQVAAVVLCSLDFFVKGNPFTMAFDFFVKGDLGIGFRLLVEGDLYNNSIHLLSFWLWLVVVLCDFIYMVGGPSSQMASIWLVGLLCGRLLPGGWTSSWTVSLWVAVCFDFLEL